LEDTFSNAFFSVLRLTAFDVQLL